jgi:hypothetical protein
VWVLRLAHMRGVTRRFPCNANRDSGGAFIGGLRYGEGMLYTKNAGDLKVFWQGPTVGYDFGGDGARTLMLVYNLPSTPAIYQ